jgi:3-methylfumaryl-CoA hydratase
LLLLQGVDSRGQILKLLDLCAEKVMPCPLLKNHPNLTIEQSKEKTPMGLISEEARKMIGTSEPPIQVEISRRDIMKYAVSTEQVLEKYLNGDEAPPMFLFGALRPIVPIYQLGPDGIANASLIPELPLKRVMAGGTKVRYFRPVKPGDVLVATRSLADMYEKSGSQGPLIFLVYKLDVKTEAGEPVVEETQTRIVR